MKILSQVTQDQVIQAHTPRANWEGFPGVIRNGDLNELSNEPEYQAAKGGDIDAAMRLVKKLIRPQTLDALRERIGESRPKLLPVIALEASGHNRIPLATANFLAQTLGLEVETSIVQSNSPKRTGKGSDYRLAFMPKFAGPVEVGQSYLIIDDTLTMGGTFAALHGHIKSNGGQVCAAMAMTAHEGSLNLPVKPAMLDAISKKHGPEMNEFWESEFGFGIDKLTQGEAGHLKSAPSVESMKERIQQARKSGGMSI